MRSKRALLKCLRVYPVLDSSLFPDEKLFAKKFLELLESPVDAIQLRVENFDSSSFFAGMRDLVAAAWKNGVPVIINDRVEAALILGASGVHLGKADIPVHVARKILGPHRVIGRTIRNRRDLLSLKNEDVDYVSIGPVFGTPIKKELGKIPIDVVREVSRLSAKPVVAIGGINAGNVRKVMDAGVQAVAFMRYGITAKDTVKAITELRRIVEERAQVR